MENVITPVRPASKILMLTDLINELEYELYQGMYKGSQASIVRAYIDQLKEQVNNLKNQNQ